MQAARARPGELHLAAQHRGDEPRRTGHHRVRVVGRAGMRLDRPVRRFDSDGLLARLQFDADRRLVRRMIAEDVARHQHEPMAAIRVALRCRRQKRRAPASDLLHDRVQGGAAWRETEQRRRDRWRRVLACDYSGLFELPQPVGQQVRRDAGQPVAQVGVAAGAADQELTHDQQRPAVADHVKRLCQRAILPIGAHHHRSGNC